MLKIIMYSQRLQIYDQNKQKIVIIIFKKMSKNLKYKSSIGLANTNCSIQIQQSDKDQIFECSNKGKKRIGKYSFYLKNIIGSGYSSVVYKGIKDNIKQVWYAIKVIRLKEMNLPNIYMLQNEIQIMQQIEHPNLMKLIDIQYTNNHCYIISEYCQGGNLQKYMKNNESIQWGDIIYQISQGCKYLSLQNIVHRDLKPANIFLQNGKWKIGDFGFSKKIPLSSSLIIESYKIGSPLFMPLETLERNMYSAKSDSFSLGVIIYYLISKEFPWNGSSLNKLIRSYRQKQMDYSRLQYLPSQIIQIIKNLCNMNMKERCNISSCNFEIFLTQKSVKQINTSLKLFDDKNKQQVILCQFINYLMKNSMLFLQQNHLLYCFLSNHLCHLTTVFKWIDNKSLKNIQEQYILPEGNHKISEIFYRKIVHVLKSTVQAFQSREQQIYKVAVEKLLEYYFICKYINEANIQQLLTFIKGITLHKNFVDLKPNYEKINQLLIRFRINQ